jgi:hypothetical protein
MVLGYSGRALWVSDGSALLRVRPSDGKVLSSTDLPSANVMAFGAGHAWVAGERPMLTEVDLATGSIMRTITFDPWPASVVEANGYLWVTNMERSSVSRLDL